MPLRPKQQRFVAEYLKDLNATQAAIRAGYSVESAAFQGSKLLADRNISQVIAEKTKNRLESADLSASRVLEEYRRLAFMDLRSFFDGDGNLKPIGQLTAEQGSAMASIEVVIKNAEAGDGHTDRVHKFKLWDKTRALESLAKHFKLLTDVIQVQEGDSLIASLHAGRAKAADAKKQAQKCDPSTV